MTRIAGRWLRAGRVGEVEAGISAAQEREVQRRGGNFPGRGNCPSGAFTEMKLSADSQAQEEKVHGGAQRRRLRCWGLPSSGAARDGGSSPRKARPCHGSQEGTQRVSRRERRALGAGCVVPGERALSAEKLGYRC